MFQKDPARHLLSLLLAVFFTPSAFAQPTPCKWPYTQCNQSASCKSTSDWPYGTTPVHWPMSNKSEPDKITDAFGPRDKDGKGDWDWHEGLDIRAAKGSAVHAPWKGKIDSMERPCFDQTPKPAGCEAKLHWVVIKHQDPKGNAFYAGYLHLDPDDKLKALKPGQSVAAGEHFANSGESGAKGAPHLHLQTMVGAATSKTHAINPVRMNSLPYTHGAYSSAQHLGLESSGFCGAAEKETLTFLVSAKADAASSSNFQDQIHHNRVRIQSPSAVGDEVVIDFDRRINDDSPVKGGGGVDDNGNKRVGNEDGSVTTRTKLNKEITLTISPVFYKSKTHTKQRRKFTVTLPKDWKVANYKKSIKVTACDSWAFEEATDCSEHCTSITTTDGSGSTSIFQAGSIAGGCGNLVSILSPAAGSTVPVNAPVTVRVTAPFDLADEEVWLEVDGLAQPLTSRSLSEWTFLWDQPTEAGTYSLRAVAMVEGEPHTDIVEITAVADAGRVSILSPADGSNFSLGETILVEASAPADAVEVRLEVTPGPSPAPDYSAPWSFSWTPATVGTHLVRAVAFLPGGAIESSATISVGVNDSALPPPRIEVSPAVFLAQRARVLVHAPVATVVGLRVKGVDQPLVERRDPVWEFAWTPSALGKHDLVATAQYSGAAPQSDTKPVTVLQHAALQITPINSHAFLGQATGLQNLWLGWENSYPTGISTKDYACSVFGFSATGGDIGENWVPDGVPDHDRWNHIGGVQARAVGGQWSILSDFNTVNKDDFFWPVLWEYLDRPETWNVNLLCVSTTVASTNGPASDKPFFLEKFKNLGDDVVKDTGIRSADYTCGVAGFAARGGDINENDDRDIMQTYLYRGGNSNWHIRADFSTHHRSENWEVDVLCANNEIVAMETPELSKPMLWKTLGNLHDNPDVSTGISASDYVCGVGGFAIRNGNINEKGGGGNLLLAYTYQRSGTWYFRGDFRTHGNHEDWTDVTILCLARQGRGPRPNVLWSRSLGGAANDFGEGVVFDGNGDVVTTGLFAETAEFGDRNLSSVGGQDAFLGKFNARHGRRIWARRFGGPNDDIGFRVAIDTNNDIGAAGWFQGVAEFGTKTLISAGDWDVFVGGFSGDGEPRWVSRLGGPSSDGPWGLSFDRGNHLLLTGYFTDTATFSDGALLTATGGSDIYLTKFRGADGLRLMGESFGSAGTDSGRGVTTDEDGGLYWAGTFSDVASLGGPPLTSSGQHDLAIAGFSPAGAHRWSSGFGGTGKDDPWDAVLDQEGNLIVAGSFTDQSNLGTGAITSAGGGDIFVAKYSSEGRPLWVKRFGGTGNDGAFAVAIDRNGNVLVAGHFEGQVDFGSESSTSAGRSDVFLAAYSPKTGFPLWVETFGGSGNDVGTDLAVYGDDIAVTGYFESSFELGRSGLASAGQKDAFLVKLGPLPSNQSPQLRLSARGSPVTQIVNVKPGDQVVVTVEASDPERDWMELRAYNVPPGAVFTNIRKGAPAIPSGIAHVTGFLEWTTERYETGIHVVSFTARDEFKGTRTAYVAISVCESGGSVQCLEQP